MAVTTTLQQALQIRPARPSDVTAVSKLGAHVFTITFGHSVPENELQSYLDESYSETATAKDIADPTKDMIVACTSDGTVVGFALLTRGTSEPCVAHLKSTVELQRIYVHPSHHGKGIGKILAQKLEAMSREQGFEYMWLGVWEENDKARKVYEKLGYSMVGDHDFVIGTIVQTDQIMLKRL